MNSSSGFRRYILLWAMLPVLIFPCLFSFPHPLLPDYGAIISELGTSFFEWMGTKIFKLTAEQATLSISDSRGLYVLFTFSLFISAIISFLIHVFLKGYTDQILQFLKVFIRYYLAWQLLTYGFQKLFKWQFYLPEPNTLYTPLGFLYKDILYWSTMGASHSYNVMMGLAELAAAGLLLFRRTSFAGAFISVLILANIAAINISYDISVKLLSLFLLYSAVILIATEPARLLSFFYGASVQSFFHPPKKQWLKGLKILIIALLLADSTYLYIRHKNFNDDLAERPALHGAYRVETLSGPIDWKRVFYHRQDYFITEDQSGTMKDYRAEFDSTAHKLYIAEDSSGSYVFEYIKDENGNIRLKGTFEEQLLDLKLHKLPLDSLPLLQKEWSFFID